MSKADKQQIQAYAKTIRDFNTLINDAIIPKSYLEQAITGVTNYIDGLVVGQSDNEKTRRQLEDKAKSLDEAIIEAEKLNDLLLQWKLDLIDISFCYAYQSELKLFCSGRVNNANGLRLLAGSSAKTKANDIRIRWETIGENTANYDGMITDWLRNTVAKLSSEHTTDKDQQLGLRTIDHVEALKYDNEFMELIRGLALQRLRDWKANGQLRSNVNKLKNRGKEILESRDNEFVQRGSAHLKDAID